MSDDKKNDVTAELKDAVERILASTSKKKLVVAGPGAGKTTLFRKLLEAAKGSSKDRLVATFIGVLKGDLERSLGDLAIVYTLHGYCQLLLRKHEELREGITADFRCYPGLLSLVKTDWEWIRAEVAPKFLPSMRNFDFSDEHKLFYWGRAEYYDAVDFDDSVFRVADMLGKRPDVVPSFELVLIDEFQDFNKMEAAVIDALAGRNSIVVAGDDDQALYSRLRGASWEHIRARHGGGEYAVFELPFCMRCPEVVVEAVNDVIAAARNLKKLDGRIEKPYRYFEPVKGGWRFGL